MGGRFLVHSVDAGLAFAATESDFLKVSLEVNEFSCRTTIQYGPLFHNAKDRTTPRLQTLTRADYISDCNAFCILLVHGQVTIIFVVSVCLSVCLFVCAELFSAVFDPISIKLGYMLYVWV